ncbi:MAG: hypothetical protein M5U19_15750 [Microthrixaceae bacterium]|nr:hypothetical protein [Microthrixaceae bacterium]
MPIYRRPDDDETPEGVGAFSPPPVAAPEPVGAFAPPPVADEPAMQQPDRTAAPVSSARCSSANSRAAR